MFALGRRWIATSVCSIILSGAFVEPSYAQDAPDSKYEIYRELRAALLEEGWKPDTGNGLKDNAGRPLYRFPEVLCGPKICNAKWRDNKGKDVSITLLRGQGGEEYRVAPQ